MVGHHAPADPAHAAARVLERALVDERLAGERAVVERRQRLRRLEADHFLGRLADHLVAIEAVQLQERFVDERVLAVRVEVDDRLRNVVREQAQLLLARGERLFRRLEVVDVVLGAVEPAHLAGGVEVRRDAPVHPALVAVRVLADPLVLDVLAELRALQDRAQERRHVGLQHFVRRFPVDLVLRLFHPVRERLVHEGVAQRAVEVGDRAGDVVGEEPQLHFLRLQRVADADVVLDVRHHREGAGDASAHVAIGEQRHAHPARFAAGALVAALVGDGRPGERALDVTLQLGERLARKHVAHGVAEQVVGLDADPVAEGLVGEADLELPVEIEDRGADAVGDEPQPVLALAGFELEPLQVVDVGVGDEEATDVTLRRAVRVVVDADPDRRAPRRDQLPLEIGPLAVERSVDVGVVERVDVAADDLDDLPADDVFVPLGDPGQERVVDELVALIAIDVGKGEPERVQLALRQGRQAVPLERLRDRLGDGGKLEPIQRTRQRHCGGPAIL